MKADETRRGRRTRRVLSRSRLDRPSIFATALPSSLAPTLTLRGPARSPVPQGPDPLPSQATRRGHRLLQGRAHGPGAARRPARERSEADHLLTARERWGCVVIRAHFGLDRHPFALDSVAL